MKKEKSKRALLPEEIEVRIDSISANSFTLVCYVTARAAMNLLDESFDNWSRRCRIEKAPNGTYYVVCAIEVLLDDGNAIVREDVGEGNTPKAAASDALKRAATNYFPALRALYTLPTLRVKAETLGIQLKTNPKEDPEGRKEELKDALQFKTFSVVAIAFGTGATGEIVKALQIADNETGDIILEYTASRSTLRTEESTELLKLKAKMIEVGISEEQVLAEYGESFGVNTLEEIANTKNIRENVMLRLSNTVAKQKKTSSKVASQLKKKKEE